MWIKPGQLTADFGQYKPKSSLHILRQLSTQHATVVTALRLINQKAKYEN